MQLNLLARFRRDRRGVSAVEFALIAPVLILIYLGLAETTMALMAERRAGHAAAVVADLVAQDTLTSSSELGDIFAVADEILSPFSAGGMKIRLTAVKAGSDGAPKVVWSKGRGLSAYGKGSTMTGLPDGMVSAYDSLIVSELSYSFTSPVRYVFPNAMTF